MSHCRPTQKWLPEFVGKQNRTTDAAEKKAKIEETSWVKWSWLWPLVVAVAAVVAAEAVQI